MAGDAFNEDDDEETRNQPAGFGGPSGISYQSTGGTTPRGGSPGFVNLGQMLALNRQSGQESANSLAKDVGDQGEAAKQGIVSAEKNYMDQSNAAVKARQPGDNEVKTRPVAYQEDYGGPQGGLENAQGNDMAAVRKNVQAANDRASGLSTQAGIAAEAGKKQSLTPTQSAASAFYMGASNPVLSDTAKKYGNLNQMLTDANTRAQSFGATGQQRVEDARNTAMQSMNRFDASNQRAQDDALAKSMGMTPNEWIQAGRPTGQSDPKFARWMAGGKNPDAPLFEIPDFVHGDEKKRRMDLYGPQVSDQERQRRFRNLMRMTNPNWKPMGDI